MKSKQRLTYRNNIVDSSPQTPKYSKMSKSKQSPLSKYNILKGIKKIKQSKEKLQQEIYQETIEKLQAENQELKKQIVQLKVHQFYHFDDKKLRQLIMQVQSQRKRVKQMQQINEYLKVQNNTLKRINQDFKLELQYQIKQKRIQNSPGLHDITHKTLKIQRQKKSPVNESNFSTTLDSQCQQSYRSSQKPQKTQYLSPRSRKRRQVPEKEDQYSLYWRNNKFNQI